MLYLKYLLEETYGSLRQHKTRSILTGFGVAWGIFILIVLVGAGEGLQKGVISLFGSYSQNSIWLTAGKTSVVVKGKVEGSPVLFPESYLYELPLLFPEIKSICAEEYGGVFQVTANNITENYSVFGVHDNYLDVANNEIKEGRFLNVFDERDVRNVVVIGDKISHDFFGDNNCVGEYILVGQLWFKIVGVCGSLNGKLAETSVFLPFSTFRSCIKGGAHLKKIGVVFNSEYFNENIEDELREHIARQLQFEVDDKRALYILNQSELVKSVKRLFGGLKGFLWFVGICLLISGVIGISNIMLIIVKERAREIGIKKALGANSKHVLRSVLFESIVISTLAGLVGMLLGMGVITFVNGVVLVGSEGGDQPLIKELVVNVNLVVGALLLLVLAGALAGLFPARKAASMSPIDAMNQNML